jgi:hypothetical protein
MQELQSQEQLREQREQPQEGLPEHRDGRIDDPPKEEGSDLQPVFRLRGQEQPPAVVVESPKVEKPAALQQGLQLHDDAFSVPLRQPVPNFPLQQPVDVQKGGFKEMQHQQPSTDTTNAGKVLPDSVTSPKPKASPLEEPDVNKRYPPSKESVSLTGLHIAIVLSVPTFVFVTITICVAFKKARQDNPMVTFRDWVKDSLQDYASFTYMQGQEAMRPRGMDANEVIVNSDGTTRRLGAEQDMKKQMHGMKLKRSAKPAAPAVRKPPNTSAAQRGPAAAAEPPTDDWDDWGTDEN